MLVRATVDRVKRTRVRGSSDEADTSSDRVPVGFERATRWAFVVVVSMTPYRRSRRTSMVLERHLHIARIGAEHFLRYRPVRVRINRRRVDDFEV